MSREPQLWTLAFADPAREAEYMQRYGTEVRRFYRFAMIAILLLWVGSVGLDFAAPPGTRAPMFFIRFACVTPVILVGIVVAFLPTTLYDRLWQRTAVLMYIVVLAGTVALVVYAPREVTDYAIGGFLLTMLIGAGLEISRAIYILVWGVVLATAMSIALLTSPFMEARFASIGVLWVVVALIGAVMISGRAEIARRRRFLHREELTRERARTEALLVNLLPGPIAARLKDGPTVIADAIRDVTVLFADLKGFTGLAAQLTPEELVERLDRVFSAFDALAQAHGLEKIKTMGDAYMAVAGAPDLRADHAVLAARMARDMITRLHELEPTLQLRIGLASGPVVAGVIGRTKHSYDLWGETVNLASRMESHGVPGRIQIAGRTRDLIGSVLAIDAGREIDLKGIGPTTAYLLAVP